MKSSQKRKLDKADLVAMFGNAASTNNYRIHVVPSGDGWAVKREGAKRAYAVRESQEEALAVAKEVKSSSEVVIHRKDGSVRRSLKK